MNIDFELYRIFYVVANHCNITKASEELSISQPAISKSIKNLEEQLGGQLFVRTKRGVVLTEEGKEFYNYIKQAIEYINNAENKFTDLINLETGCIKIGISTTLTKEFLLPYLEEFHSLYPKIDIQIITNLTSDLMPKLRNGLIDIVILNLNDKNYGNDIDIIKCKKVNDCFVVNNKYRDLIEREISLEEYIRNSTKIYADLSDSLLESIFFPNSPLHDGGVIIQGDRITCAGAVFKTSMNPDISKRLGTRHRAGLGIAEESDAIALIVSEETGRLSIAVDSRLHYNLEIDQFRMMLIDELKPKMEVFFEADESDGEEE